MNEFIKYYDWVDFFQSICKSIDKEFDNTNREKWLLERATESFKTTHSILKYETIDPFSFIYALAQCNTTNQRQIIYQNLKQSFELEIDIPTDWVFPSPTPNTPVVFYTGNEVSRNNCLWNLFKQTFNNTNISDNDLENTLSLNGVGFAKISQVMFLINPKKYIPFDRTTKSLPIEGIDKLIDDVVLGMQTSQINKIGQYLSVIQEIKKQFSGCYPYEINALNWYINSRNIYGLTIANKFCQVSSWVYSQKDDDYFDDFVEESAIWTGSDKSSGGANTYPIIDFNRGDIVLVRRGTKNLGGIAIILENAYIPDGYDKEKSIKIIWLVKEDRKIDSALGQWDGFSYASDKTIYKFKEAYPETFRILDKIRNSTNNMIIYSNNKYKNFILQGPPGTGKTRLAKQIATWLIDESPKTLSLIEALDQKDTIFIHELDIESSPQIKLIQFHPSYAYEDFVRGIRVEVTDGKPEYIVENRTLIKMAEEAAENENKAYVLIIDEINRANLTSVLGELIYALEYRSKNVSSMYEYNGSNQIMLPHNLYIIGTMNTADRSVSHIDYAIRRRFTFIPVLPDKTVINYPKAKKLFESIELLFNEFTSPEFNQEDIQIGHSYFLHNDAEIGMKLKYEIKPLLLEYIKDGVLQENAKEKIIALYV